MKNIVAPTPPLVLGERSPEKKTLLLHGSQAGAVPLSDTGS